MGGACSAHRAGKFLYRVLVEKVGERFHCGDRGVNGIIILKWMFRM